MSDQIKTQHGTIGLLMAECEQLRRDLGNAKHDLGLWAAEFDKQWPKDVKMTIANLRADLAQAKADLNESNHWRLRHCNDAEAYGKQAQERFEECQRIKAELAQAKARLNELEPLVGSPACQKYLETLQSFDEIKAENARLAAANFQMAKLLSDTRHYSDKHGTPNEWFIARDSILNGHQGTALRDLLAPTIQLLERLDVEGVLRLSHDIDRVEEELARLRSILTSSSKSDTNTP